MWSTKVEKKLFCGATVRLIPENVLQNHLHLMVKKKASTSYTTQQEKIQKVQETVDELRKRHAGKYSE